MITVDVEDQSISIVSSPIMVEVDCSREDIRVCFPGGTIQGPPGPPGTPIRYTHTQSVLSPMWIVQHNLGCHPQVNVEDAAGSVLYGSITYLDDNTLTLDFSFSITGRANCV